MESRYTAIGNGSLKSLSNGFHTKRKANGLPHINGQVKKKQKTCDESAPSAKATQKEANKNMQQFTTPKSIRAQREALPIFHHQARIIKEIRKQETLILIGETGSGKTTQLPQFMHESGLTQRGMIAITQPRRVAAITIAKRVSQEMNCELGGVVGYTVRFEDCTTEDTCIRYMTDGSLLREALTDRLLQSYSAILLDEAHERTINTDVLFGIVKEAQRVRALKKIHPLKVIVMSATMDVDHFSNYFNDCKTIYLEGRQYPIKVFHAKVDEKDYMHSVAVTLFDIHQKAPANHDILVFLTGQEEIDAMVQQIRSISKANDIRGPPLRILPLYSQLPQHKQLEVFMPSLPGTRKIILSTNIAETSITINGIKYVVDCGAVKRRTYDSVTGMETLRVEKISQAEAWQRTGRAGRQSDGFCYRTYPVKHYDSMLSNAVPEMLRSNVTATTLQLLALGIDIRHFDFMDTPPKAAIETAFKQLQMLGAIETPANPELTNLGRKMAKFPLDPRFAKIVLSAPEFGCLEEILDIVAILSGESIFYMNNEKRDQALTAHAKFRSAFGDHLTLLNVYKAFEKIEKVKLWCHENFLNIRNLTYAKDVRTQLSEISLRVDLQSSSCGANFDQVRKCLITGLFNNIGELQDNRNNYVTLVSRQRARLHPSSVLHATKPQYVLFTELVSSNQRNFLRQNTIIEPEWIHDLLPAALKKLTFSVRT